MAPEAALSPEKTVLSTEPPPEQPSDPRRVSAWAAIQTRFSKVEKPSTLPPYRFVNGTCTLKEGCTVPPRCGVGRLSQEEITYTRAILTDYLHKRWIRPSYSRTAARLFFVTKPDGGLRLVVDYRALNEGLLQLPRPCAVRRWGRRPTGKSRCLKKVAGTEKHD